MKLTIKTKDLITALESLRPVFAGRISTLPATTVVRISAAAALHISANNLDIFSDASCEADIQEPGEVAVAGLRLLGAAKNSLEAEVHIEANEKALRFTCGGNRINIAALPLEELPQVPAMENAKSLTIEADVLRDALDATLPFVSREAGRESIWNVFIEGASGAVNFVATNGRFMSAKTVPMQTPAFSAVMVPAACELLKQATGTVRLGFDENRFRAEWDGSEIVAALYNGNYPNWRQVVPAKKEQGVHVTVNREEFLHALSFVSTLILPFGTFVKMETNSGGVCLETKHQTDDSKTTIPATVAGKIGRIAFDSTMMTTILKSFSGESVTLLLRDEMSPLYFEAEDRKVVLMLARVS